MMKRRGFLGVVAVAAGTVLVPAFRWRPKPPLPVAERVPYRLLLQIGASEHGPGGWIAPETSTALFVSGDHVAFDYPRGLARFTAVGLGPHYFPVLGGLVKVVGKRYPNHHGTVWTLYATEGVVI